jgi:hypothetical protein
MLCLAKSACMSQALSFLSPSTPSTNDWPPRHRSLTLLCHQHAMGWALGRCCCIEHSKFQHARRRDACPRNRVIRPGTDDICDLFPPMSAAAPERHRRLSRVFTSRLLPNPTRHGPPQTTDSLTSVSPTRAKSESRGRSNGATIDQSYMLLPATFEHRGLSIPVVRVSRQPLRVTSCLKPVEKQ